MRTTLVAGLIALVLPGCIVGGELTGVGGGGEEGGEEGEGEGSGSGSGSGTTLTPRVTASLDKTSVTTENGKTEMVTVSLASEDGFAGNVVLAPTLVDASDIAVPGVTIDGPASVTLAADGTGTATYAVSIPSNTTGAVMTASLKVGVMSSAGSEDLTSAVTINNFYTVEYGAGTGANQNDHPMRGMNVTIKRGTIIKFPNTDTIDHIIHGGGAFPHENTTVGVGGVPGRTYEVNTIGTNPGASGTLGCHTHGTGSYSTYTVQ